MSTTIIPQIYTKFTDYKTPFKPSLNSQKVTKKTICCYNNKGSKLRFEYNKNLQNLLFIERKDGLFKDKKRVVLVKFSSLGGGGDDGGKGRMLGNVVLAIGLTYLTLTGQLGWILDVIVSVWLFVVIVPILGLGALIWWASRDMVEIKCRNCENEFEVFKSMLNDEPQLCPYCNQPFSVVGDQFVRDPSKFSKEPTTFDEAFNDLFSRTKKGKASSGASSRAVIDVEAEVKDIE